MLRLVLTVGSAILLAVAVLMAIQVFLGRTKDALDQATPPGHVEVEGKPKCTVDDREMVVAGVLRNRGLGIVDNVSITVIWRSASGRIVSTQRTDVLERRPLLPSAAMSFRTSKATTEGAKSCEVSVSASQ